jgi:hypothetical protein
MGVQGIELSLLVAVLVLLALRGVDFVAGGSTYRLFVGCKRYVNSTAAEIYAHTTKAAHSRPGQVRP